jgi:hypothetical protein
MKTTMVWSATWVGHPVATRPQPRPSQVPTRIRKSGLKTLMAVAALAAVSSEPLAQQGRVTVFGIRLQQPLVIAECRYRELSGGYDHNTFFSPCFQRLGPDGQGSAAPPSTGLVRIIFPLGRSPNIVRGNLLVGVVDGKVASLAFKTFGSATGERDLAALKEKFGEPASIERQSMPTASPDRNTGIAAVWNLAPDVSAIFHSAADPCRCGMVRIESTTAGVLSQAELLELRKSGQDQ